MKNVILYVRVSTDEQADKGFSLRDQEEKLLRYCSENNLNVLEIYREDYSAKTFNRPEMNKLIAHCKRDHRTIDQLLFVKWDRFSRNTSESYNKINLFNSLGITPNAIAQPLDLSIPEQGLMLAVYLSVPEVENLRRSQNVIAGMRRAMKEGRYVGSPPKGYDMGRDASKRPVLTPNGDAPFIQEAFELMATGIYNQKEVFQKLKAKGLRSSSSAFARILRNPLYCGLVYLKAHKEEWERYIEGIHQPLVSKKTFDTVQSVLDGRNKQKGKTHKKVNPNFPLRGFVMCPKCNRPLSASSSKGRGGYYSYYHCFSPCDVRIKKEDVHTWFEEFLRSISLDGNSYALLTELIREEFKKIDRESSLGPKHYEKIKNLETKLEKIQDLFIEGDLSKEEYNKAKKRFQKLIDELKERESQLAKKQEVFKLYKDGLKSMENFDKQYLDSDIEHKRLLVGSIFPENFQFENKKVRTADINPILLKIASVNKGLKENKKRDKPKKIDLSRSVLKAGLEPARP
jgi:DNA invertase Pin-like site-specific DNA recombinase